MFAENLFELVRRCVGAPKRDVPTPRLIFRQSQARIHQATIGNTCTVRLQLAMHLPAHRPGHWNSYNSVSSPPDLKQFDEARTRTWSCQCTSPKSFFIATRIEPCAIALQALWLTVSFAIRCYDQTATCTRVRVNSNTCGSSLRGYDGSLRPPCNPHWLRGWQPWFWFERHKHVLLSVFSVANLSLASLRCYLSSSEPLH